LGCDRAAARARNESVGVGVVGRGLTATPTPIKTTSKRSPQWAIYTATQLCHRFYAVRSMARNDRFVSR
jgi:hypothetical protein